MTRRVSRAAPVSRAVSGQPGRVRGLVETATAAANSTGASWAYRCAVNGDARGGLNGATQCSREYHARICYLPY